MSDEAIKLSFVLRSRIPRFLRQLHDVFIADDLADGDGLFWDEATQMWKNGSGNGNGGSSPSVTTATLTLNRAGGFVAVHDFDLGDTPNVLQITYTLTARVADGETWGEAGSDIFVELAGISALGSGVIAVSDNGSTFAVVANSAVPEVKHGSTSTPNVLVAVNDAAVEAFFGMRYLRVAAGLYAADTFDVYAGANNPTASIGVSVRYVT